jgi:predicted transcriptional regulator
VVLAETAELGFPADDLRIGTEPTNLLVDRLSERFAVSKQAASIRLATLGLVTTAGVVTLPLP